MNDLMQGVLIGFILGLFISVMVLTTISVPNSAVVEHGAAYYHPQTKDLTWTDTNETITQ